MKTLNTVNAIRPYSLGEEVGNAVSHGAMALVTLCGIAPGAIYAYERRGALAAFGTSVFMCSIFLMFLSSALYHSMTVDIRYKQVLRILDHIFIYVAIAGSYTPVALSVIGGWPGALVASAQWVMVLFGILYKSIIRRGIPKISLAIYLIMGWSILLVLPMFIRRARLGLQVLILCGGVFYSAGTFFYSKKDIKFFHMIWHFFVSLGALCHFIGILLFL